MQREFRGRGEPTQARVEKIGIAAKLRAVLERRASVHRTSTTSIRPATFRKVTNVAAFVFISRKSRPTWT
jgi:hypothetical protein